MGSFPHKTGAVYMRVMLGCLSLEQLACTTLPNACWITVITGFNLGPRQNAGLNIPKLAAGPRGNEPNRLSQNQVPSKSHHLMTSLTFVKWWFLLLLLNPPPQRSLFHPNKVNNYSGGVFFSGTYLHLVVWCVPFKKPPTKTTPTAPKTTGGLFLLGPSGSEPSSLRFWNLELELRRMAANQGLRARWTKKEPPGGDRSRDRRRWGPEKWNAPHPLKANTGRWMMR